MEQPKIIVYKNWIEMLNPLLASDPEAWETVVALAVGIAFGDFEPCLIQDSRLERLWSLTEIIPATNGQKGIIRIKKKYGPQVS